MTNQPSLALGMQAVPDIQDLPLEEVMACPTLHAAFRLSLHRALTKRTDDQWAELFGCTPGTFHQILYQDQRNDNRVRHIPSHWFTDVQLFTGNKSVGQWVWHKPEREKILSQIEQRKAEIEQLNISLEA